MIKGSLRLIFILGYESTYLWSESEKRNHFAVCFVLFNEPFVFVVFLTRSFLVVRENGDYFTGIISIISIIRFLLFCLVFIIQ